jgi:hypothetical protein
MIFPFNSRFGDFPATFDDTCRVIIESSSDWVSNISPLAKVFENLAKCGHCLPLFDDPVSESVFVQKY